jgi:riboflavin synthase
MFTGLIEDIGTIVARAPLKTGSGERYVFRTRLPEVDLFIGASVAVDGTCLTVIAKEAAEGGFRFTADLSEETLSRTTLGEKKAGDEVNLERPLALGDRLGGHLVLGHVDGIAHIISRAPAGEMVRFRVALPQGLSRLVVEKGSIAVDGISLTVNEMIGDDDVALLLIPETLRKTTWASKSTGDTVNVEADILGKHVARLLQTRGQVEKRETSFADLAG